MRARLWMRTSWRRLALVGLFGLGAFLMVGTLAHLAVRPRASQSESRVDYSIADGQLLLRERAAVAAAPAHDPMMERADGGGGFGVGAIELTALTDYGRQIVRTADLLVDVEDIEAGYQQVMRVADSVGAVVAGANLNRRPDDDGREEVAGAQFTLRVPSAQFFRLLNALAQLGTVTRQDISSTDVTEQFVDLESRLRHWRVQEEQLLGILRRSGTIKDILAVRNELAQVQLEIERLEGQLRYLHSRVDLSTVTVTLTPQSDTMVAASSPFGAQIAGGWGRVAGAFGRSLRDLVTVLTWLGLVAAYLVPFAALVLLGVGGYRIVRPRLARKPA